MNTLIGLLIIAIGSFGQSSSYVPINKVKNWSWESFWLVQGIFAWLVSHYWEHCWQFQQEVLSLNYGAAEELYQLLYMEFYGVSEDSLSD